jgi:hypothetical protein
MKELEVIIIEKIQQLHTDKPFGTEYRTHKDELDILFNQLFQLDITGLTPEFVNNPELIKHIEKSSDRHIKFWLKIANYVITKSADIFVFIQNTLIKGKRSEKYTYIPHIN